MVFMAAILENDRDLTDTYVKDNALRHVRKNLSSYVKLGHTRRR